MITGLLMQDMISISLALVLDIFKVKAIAGLLPKREQKEASGLLMLATNTAKNLHS